MTTSAQQTHQDSTVSISDAIQIRFKRIHLDWNTYLAVQETLNDSSKALWILANVRIDGSLADNILKRKVEDHEIDGDTITLAPPLSRQFDLSEATRIEVRFNPRIIDLAKKAAGQGPFEYLQQLGEFCSNTREWPYNTETDIETQSPTSSSGHSYRVVWDIIDQDAAATHAYIEDELRDVSDDEPADPVLDQYLRPEYRSGARNAENTARSSRRRFWTWSSHKRLVPFRRQYDDMRAEVARAVGRLMIYRSNPSHPERVIDEVLDLRHIHTFYDESGARSGDPIELKIILVRDLRRYVRRIRVAAPNVHEFPPDSGASPPSSVDDPIRARAARIQLLRPFRAYMDNAPSPGHGDDRVAVLPYLARLRVYKESVKSFLDADPRGRRINGATLKAYRTVLPRWIYISEDARIKNVADRALRAWNDELSTADRRAIRHTPDKESLKSELDEVYARERSRYAQ